MKIAILGASGYTGFELLRILAGHPKAEIIEATSRQFKGRSVSEVFPSLAGYYGLKFSDPEDFRKIKADFVFSALPHGASQEAVPALLGSGNRVIDLSADYRLKEPDVYAKWYGEHASPGLLKKAVYGLPELHRKKIVKAALVANPGCYPTGAILALAPLVKMGLARAGSIIIDSKSGVSGAGRGANLDTSFVEVSEGFKAYKIGTHRHTPEMEQELGALSKEGVSVTFTPHLIPVSRGILTTAYADLTKALTAAEVHSIYSAFYKQEPFVRVMPEGRFPDISQVKCSNYCDIGVWADGSRKKVIIVSAIDNLVKGASGQAVQNMNIMSGMGEKTSLDRPPAAI
jgi:N-acetyl-gamma-glutamyl-phosphate reductase